MSGVERIAVERQRQIDVEGWTAEHDADLDTPLDYHRSDQLAIAAACYALPIEDRLDILGELWPWASEWWKPTPNDRIRELEKAGALIAAEIDRLEALR